MNELEIIKLLNKHPKDASDLDYIKNNYVNILKILFKDADEATFLAIIEMLKNHPFLKNFKHDLYYFQPINPRLKKGWENKEIINSDLRKESLVALNSYDKNTKEFIQLHPRIFVNPVYFKAQRKGTFPEIYVREQVLESILNHLELLPSQYAFMIYDGFRTFECQKDIYDEIFNQKFLELKKEKKQASEEEIKEYLKKEIMPNYVSYPSFNPPSTHNTGGAIDMRICDNLGNVLNYGCPFDDFETIANSNYFDNKLSTNHSLTNAEIESLLIRRVSINLLKYPTKNLVHTKAIKKINKFTEFIGEDWHIDLNNQWDMDLDKAIYGSCEKDNIIPNPNYTINDYLEKYHK